jgi:hypothetical protein
MFILSQKNAWNNGEALGLISRNQFVIPTFEERGIFSISVIHGRIHGCAHKVGKSIHHKNS